MDGHPKIKAKPNKYKEIWLPSFELKIATGATFYVLNMLLHLKSPINLDFFINSFIYFFLSNPFLLIERYGIVPPNFLNKSPTYEGWEINPLLLLIILS